MYRFISVFMIFIVSLVAREEAFAVKECPAFNNMKHSKNTHNIILDTSVKYPILRYHKGQALILIKGEQPAQRWVDDTCFLKTENTQKPVLESSSVDGYIKRESKKNDSDISQKQNLLVLSWHNAFCQTRPYKKECKKSALPQYKESHFVLHGFWPQPKNNTYCGVDKRFVSLDKHRQWNRLPILPLSERTIGGLSHFMPGFASNLHRHEWIKHGTCYAKDAEYYYRDVIALMEQFEESGVNAYFTKFKGKRVTLMQVRYLFDSAFGKGTGKRVEMKCYKGLVTELWLHLGSDSDDLSTLLKRGKQTRSYCTSGIVDKAGF